MRVAEQLVLLACVGGTVACGDAKGPCEAEVAHVVNGDTQVSEVELSPRATDEQCEQACRSLVAEMSSLNFYLHYYEGDTTEAFTVKWCERTGTLSNHPAGL